MAQVSIMHIPFLLLLPVLPDLTTLFIGAACAFVFSYLLTFAVRAVCFKMGWLDQPAERRIHKKAVPRLGGVAMFLAFVLVSLLFYTPGYGPNDKFQLLFGLHIPDELVDYWLLIAAATLIVAVHAYDDVKGLNPWLKLLAQTLAVIIILAPGRMMFHGMLLYTFNNPFYRTGLPFSRDAQFHLFIQSTAMSWMAIPAVLFTWFWIVGMMNTVNLIDGLDGLATGVVMITGLFITIISWQLRQDSIAVLSAIFTGAVFGFLPHNWNPASIFMGDSGSQFLGLTLAVLSIVGGAKVALALMVIGLPILDVAIVMINRVRRGQHPLHYDKTHLHYRLLATGLSVKQICYVFYALTLIFGVLALNLHLIYKLAGIALVVLTMIGLIAWIDYRQRQQGKPIKIGGPDPGSGGQPPSLQREADAKKAADEETSHTQAPYEVETSHPLPDLPH
ncbi:MAG TPA: MraY family glycosyltransferase [Ktedonobacteraceae bacterium]|nr:MraY family glycosyltransferase [Ktedonobacteraceae bacterium]